ncbi:hypothetical protein D3C81_1976370 [compost metagenome]
MNIRRQGIARHTDRTHPALATQAKAQHHDQRQGQAVGAQLHGLPATGPAPQLPAIGIAAQATEGCGMSQENLPGQHPGAVRQAQQDTRQAGPQGNIE